MDTNTAVTALSALAQASRLALFRRLVELGPAGAVPGELSQALGLAPATLSFHLKTLVHAGLIEAEPRGRFIHYRADFGRMRTLVDYLTENCCGGDASRCAPAADATACTPGAGAIPVSEPRASRPRRRAR